MPLTSLAATGDGSDFTVFLQPQLEGRSRRNYLPTASQAPGLLDTSHVTRCRFPSGPLENSIQPLAVSSGVTCLTDTPKTPHRHSNPSYHRRSTLKPSFTSALPPRNSQGYTPLTGCFWKNVAVSSNDGSTFCTCCTLSRMMSYPKLYAKNSSGFSGTGTSASFLAAVLRLTRRESRLRRATRQATYSAPCRRECTWTPPPGSAPAPPDPRY